MQFYLHQAPINSYFKIFKFPSETKCSNEWIHLCTFRQEWANPKDEKSSKSWTSKQYRSPQTSGRVLKSFTALSLAATVIVPSSLLYWMEESLRQLSSKSNILVHWEKTIAFSPATLSDSFTPLSASDFLLSSKYCSNPLERGSEFSDDRLGKDKLGLDSVCSTSRAALIFEEWNGLHWKGSSLSEASKEQSGILSWPDCSEREHFNVALENTDDKVSLALQFLVGHWLSSPEICSQTHWLQKTCPQLVTTASSGGS